MIEGMSDFINHFNIVRQIPVFSKLNWFEVQRIARVVRLEEYQKGDFIRREGDPPDYLYCLVSGRLLAYTVDANGRKRNEDFISKGMYFGVLSLFTGENHSMSFEALNDALIMKIPKDEFHSLLKSMPHLAIEFSRVLSKRMRRKVKGMKAVFESFIISVYSPVKGTGSSTYAHHLSASLAKETGQRVIRVHIHSQSQILPVDGVAPAVLPENAVDIKHIKDNYEKTKNFIQEGKRGFDVLSVKIESTDILKAEDKTSSVKKYIAPLVSSLGGVYHYVVVDLPNNMDDVVMETLTQSDMIHLISSDEDKDLILIRGVIERLRMNLQERFDEDKVRVILCGGRSKEYLSFEAVDQKINYPVHTFLPFVSGWREEISVHGPEERSREYARYDKVVRYMAREIGGVLVGLVLGGGAALGLAHIGVLKVLEQEDIPVDIIVGSSMGALIGSLWATGKKSEELEAIGLEFEKKRNVWKLLDPILPVSGLIGGRAIRRWLKQHLGHKTFLSTRIPLKIVAYDIKNRQELIIHSGLIREAVYQSIAIPGVFKPIQNKGRVVMDGGVLNPLPTNVMASLGIKKMISVNVLKSPEEVYQSVQIKEKELEQHYRQSFWSAPLRFIGFRIQRFFSNRFNPNISDIIVQTLQATEYQIAEQSAQQADVDIHPNLVGMEWYELYRAGELIQRGEDAAKAKMPEIRTLFARKDT